jgi:PAS domain S-box-containing protein
MRKKISPVTENLRRELAQEGVPTFQYIVENSIDAILMTDADLQVVYANRACKQLIARNVTGQPLMSLWFEEDLPLLNNAVEWARVGAFFSTAQLNGFHSVIDQYPGIEIVGTLAADWNREKGRQATEEFLRASPPGTLDVIWAASGEMGLGAMEAVEAAGRQDEVTIFTNDVTPESADRMREGRLMAETHHGFADWGWYGTKFAVMLALSQAVPPTLDIRPRTMYEANADLFYPTPVLEPIDWTGIKAGQQLPDKITIGWVQMAASGVYQTATDFFEKAAAKARRHGLNVELITRIPTTPEDFDGQAAIIEDYIQSQVDVIALSTVEVDVVRQAIKKASQAGIPVIIVNQLEPIEGIEVASYIGFDNTVAGMISGYAVVDYLGGPGILGKGEQIEVEPGTYLDLAWWQALYQDVDPRTIEVKGRVAIIEGISGSWRGENRLVRSDGSVIYVDSISFPVHNQAGQFTGLVASFRDTTQQKQTADALEKTYQEVEKQVEERTAELRREISERKQAEEALRASEERFALAERGANDGLYDWDIQNGSLYWSPRLKELLGYTADELEVDFNTFESHLHPDDRERIGAALEAHLKDRVLYDVEERLRTKSGEYRWFNARGQALWDEAGNPTRMTGHITDITKRKQAEEALAQQAQELARSNKELEQFAYIASHDLQEPLRMIKSYLQLLERRYRGQLDEDADVFIAFAVDGAARLQILINDLLKYSRVETHGKPFKSTDCGEVLGQVLENLKVAVEESQALVTYDDLPTVMADGVQLLQLFQNLISNALKFHQPDSPLEVHIGVEQLPLSPAAEDGGGSEWLFSVQDNGIGIDPEYFEHIFMIFQRLHTRAEYKGTGIGLAVCKKIVERHGGRMWVESELEKGTTFYFTIPDRSLSDL